MLRHAPSQALVFSLVTLSLVACKPAPSSSPLAALPPPPVDSPAAAAAVELPPPPLAIYGFVRIPSTTRLLTQVGAVLPPAYRAFLSEPLLRSSLGAALGSRAALTEHIVLDRPMGCVITSPLHDDRPFACAVAYAGGFSALMRDLGPDGFVSGTEGYAHYRIEGQPVFLTAMGDHIAIAFVPDLITTTREALERDIIDAPLGDDEVVATAYPSVIFEDARDQIDDALHMMLPSPSADPNTAAYMEAQRKQWLSWAELERADLWLDLSDSNVELGYRGTALAGTATATAYDGAHALGQDRELLALLPGNALAVGGMGIDISALADDPMLGAYMQTLGSLDGSDANASLAKQYRDGLALWTEQTTGRASMALLHERGTKGGFVMAYRLKPDVDALPKLREIFARYGEPTALSEQYRVELRPGAFRAGKVRGDLLVMKPTPALLAQPGASAIPRVLGSPPQLQMAYAQRGDLLFMAMAPGKAADRYLRRVLGKPAGKGRLDGREDARPLLDEHGGDTWMVAADVGAIVAWLVAIEAIEAPPLTFPERLDDVVLTLRPSGERQREVQLDVSSALVRTIVQLATT